MSKLSREFAKNTSLEQVLQGLNESIEAIDTGSGRGPRLPLMFLFGCPRSGTTLFMQWLASLGCFGYPTNFVSRFFGNPAFGCEVQKALIDLDHDNQLGLIGDTGGYDSNLGRTQGALAPSEFWYYWRRFFKFADSNKLSEQELSGVDADAFLVGLGAMELSITKPLAMKAMIMNWHIPYLSNLSDRIFSVSIQRDIFDVAQSVLFAREMYSGGREVWWSFKPPEYRQWLELTPIEQVAAQVVYTQRAVQDGMASLDDSRKLELTYQEFCDDPRSVFGQICDSYAGFGYQIKDKYSGGVNFECNTNRRLSLDDEKKLRCALDKYSAEVALG